MDMTRKVRGLSGKVTGVKRCLLAAEFRGDGIAYAPWNSREVGNKAVF